MISLGLNKDKVRDIHLSGANKDRKRGFAFVRFATLDEARRVAEKTKGMHMRKR
ncbi:hypothetical protein QYF36_002507 [Acer negundo]|nr:hypothetical protein QYF36_002507 [Acer negundo]